MSQAVAWVSASISERYFEAVTAHAAIDSQDGYRLLRAAAAAGPPGDGAPSMGAMAYAGAIPGPTLRLKRGEDLKLRLENGLAEATGLDWHGLRGANLLDGTRRRASAAPAARLDYRIACPDAGTFWYHAVLPRQIGCGLYGLIVVDEAEPVAVDRELHLVVGEWPALEGAVATSATRPPLRAGGVGATETVRANERLRLRFLNATRRIVAMRIDGHRPVVMALDGQPADPFVARDGRILLGPGNRADLFVDMVLSPGATAMIVAESAIGATPLTRLVYADAPARGAPLAESAPLPANDLPARMDFAGALKLDLVLPAPTESAGDMSAAALPAEPAFRVQRGRAVMLGIVNRTTATQVARVDGHTFRLLDRLDDGWKPFWLDTLTVPAGQTHRIAFVPDRAGAWLIESVAEASGAAGLATWFEVT